MMAGFIAFCETPNCGAIFENKQLFGGNGSVTIHMTDTKVGPCPSCGGFGRIPNGIYSYANNAINFLTGPSTSVELLKKLEKFLVAPKRTMLQKKKLKMK